MTKKFILSLAAFVLCGVAGFSQGLYDALRYSEQYTEGTARSVAMGNAFVALGGDLGAITINPAATGVYRFSEVSFTPTLTNASSTTSYLGTNISDNKTRFGVSNFGYVGTVPTGRTTSGLISWNWGVAFNKQNNFTGITRAAGRNGQSSWLSNLASQTNGIIGSSMDMNDANDPFFNSGASWTSILGWNTSIINLLPDSNSDYYAATENLNGYDIIIPGDLDQRFSNSTVGNVSEAVVNLGGNISNKLFFGFNLCAKSIWYKYNETYSETAVNSNLFQSGFEHFSHSYRQRTSGTGISLKAGVIYVPVQGLRIGASISTPSWLFLHEEWDENITSKFNDGYEQDLISPLGSYDYRINTPFRWNVGAAYTIGHYGAISVDYEQVNYSQAKLRSTDDYYAYGSFDNANSDIKQELATQDIVRVGAEIKPTEEFAIRAGFQYYSSPYKNGSNYAPYNNNSKNNTKIGSLGIGYVSPSGFFADVAYQQLLSKNQENFTLYNDSPVGTNKMKNWKLLLTLGLRF